MSENGTIQTFHKDSGSAGGAVERAGRVTKRTRWVDLPQEEYPTWKVYLWVNFPAGLLEDIRSGDESKAREALRRIVLEHNGWQDEEGEELVPADHEDFYRVIPTEVLGCLMALIQQECAKLPNSLLATRRS